MLSVDESPVNLLKEFIIDQVNNEQQLISLNQKWRNLEAYDAYENLEDKLH